MIFLRQKNLLFLKSLKTAATSVEIALSTNATGDDIVTPVSFDDEFFRIDLGGQFPVNWAKNKALETQYRTAVFSEYRNRESQGKSKKSTRHFFSETIRRWFKKEINSNVERLNPEEMKQLGTRWETEKLFYNHIPPREIIPLLGEAKFKAAHKVSICRHPYDQLVSHAYWKARDRKPEDVQEVLEQLLSCEPPNLPYYMDGDQKVCDTVLRYENLEDDIRDLERKFNITLADRLPVTKSRSRTGPRQSHEMLTRQQKERCFQRNRVEFELFGYDPYL